MCCAHIPWLAVCPFFPAEAFHILQRIPQKKADFMRKLRRIRESSAQMEKKLLYVSFCRISDFIKDFLFLRTLQGFCEQVFPINQDHGLAFPFTQGQNADSMLCQFSFVMLHQRSSRHAGIVLHKRDQIGRFNPQQNR